MSLRPEIPPGLKRWIVEEQTRTIILPQNQISNPNCFCLNINLVKPMQNSFYQQVVEYIEYQC
jgi:hypothetical protein